MKKKKRVPNYPRIIGWSLGLIVVLCIVIFFGRLIKWNRGVEYVMTDEDYANIKLDTKDNITILPASIFAPETDDGVPTILVLGNDSYYAGLEDKSGITDYLSAELPDATIINCCFPGSTMTTNPNLESTPELCPENYFTVFWLMFAKKFNDFASYQDIAISYLDPNRYDIDAYNKILQNFKDVDLAKVDLVLFCYDGHDYLNGALPKNNPLDENTISDVKTVLGALYGTVLITNDAYPNIQYVFISPTFCYANDESGKQVPCTILNTGNGNMSGLLEAARETSSYVGLSYMDMIAGIELNEDTADNYLEDDGITPNQKARRMIADRIVELLSNRL